MDHKIDDDMVNYMKSSLDRMAERVRRIVGEDEPLNHDHQEHTYYCTDPGRCSQIINGIKRVMFEEDNFGGNTQDYYNVKNSFITEVRFIELDCMIIIINLSITCSSKKLKLDSTF